MPSQGPVALLRGRALWLWLSFLFLARGELFEVGDGELAFDEECGGEGDEACAVRMLQLNGRKVGESDLNSLVDEASGSCSAYGCVGYKPSQSCQCNAKCTQFGNCCDDYKQVCPASARAQSCQAYGCGKFDPSKKCQCNDKCQKYGNCCSDYASKCAKASCQAFGCGKYDRSRSCQCNDKCATFGNCCNDYQPVCASGSASCQAYGCGGFDASRKCQCNDKCGKYGNCCNDYQSVCAAGSATCKAYGCGGFDASRKCQCNDKCGKYGNCCPDYSSACPLPTGSASCSAIGCGVYDKSQQCQCNEECAKYGNCCQDYKGTCTGNLPGNVSGHPSASKNYPFYKGFTLTVAEEFDKPLDLDSDPIWTWSDGGLIEGQIRYVKEGIKFEDGKMKISVGKYRPKVQACSIAETAIIPEKTLASGEMRSKHNMFRYGRYEARIKAPEVQPGDTEINGNFVATMFVFRDGKYKHWREIDVEITGNGVDTLHTNILSADHTPEWNADMGEEKDHKVGRNLRKGFHTYAIEWLPNRIRWFFDGKIVREKIGGKIPIPTMSAKVMMNLWVFDDRALFGGKEIKNNRFPLTSEYDWFRFYKWDGDTHYPCSGLSTACLTTNDWYLSGNNPCDGIATQGTVYGRPACTARCFN